MNEFPNTVGDEAAFWAQQRSLPHGAERPDDGERRWPLSVAVPVVMIAGAAMWLGFLKLCGVI